MTDARTPEPLIHVAVAEHAARQPEATALYHDGTRVSYQTLEQAANAYAAELSSRGVGVGETVPIVLPRSLMLAAVELAVLKCGAAYTNLDPAWPAERHAVILHQVSPKVVVTQQALLSGPFTAMRLDDDITDVAARAASFTPVIVANSAPATVFFTSGTTGQPKGVVVPHRAVTRLFGVNGLPGFGPGHTTPQVAALAWDMYAFDVWGQLTSGGCVALASGSHVLPSTLRELVGEAGADTMFLTTSLFNLFVDEDPACFEGIKQLIVGGEKLSAAHVRTFLRRFPSTALRNGYGPAENCMLTTTHVIRPDDCDIAEGIPVGTPTPGTTVHVLTGDDRPCEPGQLGEICVAGSGLAVGYLGDPELTTRKFPTVTIGGEPVRVYRTGDLGFVDEHGVLHFRGRQDRQVKINGVRVELAEIEITAGGVGGVREAVVLPLTAPDGPVTGLALCYVAELDGPDEPRLRAELSRVLPANLVPGVIRRVEHFPVTANGKVDHAQLRHIATRRRGRSARTPGRVEGGHDVTGLSHDARTGVDVAR